MWCAAHDILWCVPVLCDSVMLVHVCACLRNTVRTHCAAPSYEREMQNGSAPATLRSAIIQQFRQWLPSVTLLSVSTEPDVSRPTTLIVRISYEIDFLATKDSLDLLFEY